MRSEIISSMKIISVIILILILSSNGSSLILFNTNTFRQYYIYTQLKPNIEQLIGDDWVINKIGWRTIRRTGENRYSVYVEIESIKINNRFCWNNDYITVDGGGNILRESLTENIRVQIEHAKSTNTYNMTKHIL